MKRLFAILLVMSLAFGQMETAKKLKDAKESYLDAGVGYANIDGESYFMMNITPDLSFGKFGAGLNLELMFGGEDGFKFRKDAYENGAGWLRIIRYLRWGHKGDEVHLRVGTIDNGTLGNGFLMFHYTNEGDYDNRKIGAVIDLDFNDFGIETIYSNFGRPEIFGARAYYRPLVNMNMPVISTLEVGGTYLTDSYADPNGKTPSTIDNGDKLSMFGFDIGMYLAKTDMLKWKLYYDFGKISDYGSGSAIGTSFNFGAMDAINFHAKYERRILGDEFMPSVFGPLYELHKSTGSIKAALANMKGLSGNFFEVGTSLLNTFHFTGNWQKLDDPENMPKDATNETGTFYGELSVDADLPFEIAGRYVKTGIESISDLPGFNENSLAEVELGYQINTYLFLTTTYRWNWVEKDVLDGNGDKTGNTTFESQRRIIPKLSFRYNF